MRPTGGKTEELPSPRARAAWLELSDTHVVRSLAVLQSIVIIATSLGVVAFTAIAWYWALLAGLALSFILNLALFRYTRKALDAESDRAAGLAE